MGLPVVCWPIREEQPRHVCLEGDDNRSCRTQELEHEAIDIDHRSGYKELGGVGTCDTRHHACTSLDVFPRCELLRGQPFPC